MNRRVAIALSLGLGLTMALLCLLGSQSHSASADSGIRYVAPGGDCGGAIPCYATIQAAVDAADPGDLIKVALGTYSGVQTRPAPGSYHGPAAIAQAVYISKTVTIRGGYAATFADPPNPETNPTTLDAQGQGRVIFVDRDISPIIEGLRITGGDASGLGGDHWGYDAGGGLFLWYSDPAVSISNNQVFSNTAANGGGLYVFQGAATLGPNSVAFNTASAYGGGLFLYSSDATLSANTVVSNSADSGGGGMFTYYCDHTISGNIIRSNTTKANGGGLSLQGGTATLVNNVIADNQAKTAGSGLYLWESTPQLIHSTIARNHGGYGSGIYMAGSKPSTATLTNTILVGHRLGIVATAGYTATLDATLWYGNETDYSGNVARANDRSGDPAFDVDGYHLTDISAAIDSGMDAGVTRDLDRDIRPQGIGYDIGADEFRQWWYTHLPVVLSGP
jgi:hypothetical protein